MGLFGFLDKKQCVICGADIGAIFSGSNKISEGSVCKNCCAKLSPFFRDYAAQTVDSINTQLEYREANKEEVANFRTTRSYGLSSTKLLIDENQGKFMVTRASNLATANPDVINCSDVTSCHLDVDCDESEIRTKDKDGKPISYNPKRYEYDYNFYIEIGVNHPYFNKIRFQINDDTVHMESIVTGGAPVGGGRMMPPPSARPMQQAAGRAAAAPQRAAAPAAGGARHIAPCAKPGAKPAPAAPAGKLGAASKMGAAPARSAAPAGRAPMGGGMMGMMGGTVTKPDPLTDPNYVMFQQTGEEIKWALMNARQDARQMEAEASAPKMAVVCACCGATTFPDASGCCEYCGGPVNG